VVGVNGPCAVPLADLDRDNDPGNAKVVHRVPEDVLETLSTTKLTDKCKLSLLLPTVPFTLFLVMMVHVAILNGPAGVTVALTDLLNEDSDGRVTLALVNGGKKTKLATKEPTRKPPSNNVTLSTTFNKATSPVTNKTPSKSLISELSEAETLTPVKTCTTVDESTTVCTQSVDRLTF
jgi:hypothetical protein